jgi:hypothetical protein
MILRRGSTNVAPVSNSSGADGGDITANNINGANSNTWWGNNVAGPGFNSTNWDMAANRLPRLKTTTGAAFNQAQNPTMTP